MSNIKAFNINYYCVLDHIGEVRISQDPQSANYMLTVNRAPLSDLRFWQWLNTMGRVPYLGKYNVERKDTNELRIIYSIRNNRPGKSTYASRVVEWAVSYVIELYEQYLKCEPNMGQLELILKGGGDE